MDGGAGNRPDAATCIAAQIGQSSSGSPLGICCWPGVVDLPTTDPANVGTSKPRTWTWPNDRKS